MNCNNVELIPRTKWHISSCCIDKLPHEVLTKIFEFLRASERKNVRSTCSDWYDACNSLQICKTEKLRINVDVKYSLLVFDTLTACKFKCLNLEFENFQFCQSSIPFWETCGERILSLTMRECFLENDLVINAILRNCTNLQSLSIDSLLKIHDFENRSIEAVTVALKHCDIVMMNLTTLKLQNCHFLNDFIYSTMVGILPNIRELFLENVKINCYKRVDKRFYGESKGPYNREDIFSFTCVFDHLKSAASHIKRLSLHSIGDKGLTSDWIDNIAMIKNLRLDHLSLEGHSLFSERSLVNLLRKQTDLTKLRIRRCVRVSYDAVADQVQVRLACQDIEYSC